MKVSKTALFGGAIMAAGIAQTAAAQTMTLQDSGTYAGSTFYSFSRVSSFIAYGGSGATNTISNYTSPGADLDQNLNYNGLDVNAVNNNTVLRIDSTWDGTGGFYTFGGYYAGYGGAFLQQFFTVDSDATLRITWDVTDTDSFGDNIFVIEDGVAIENFDPGTAGSGTLDIAATAGVEYGINFDIEGPFFFTPGTTSFIQLEVIPAPGTAALAGLAGLAAVRRRR